MNTIRKVFAVSLFVFASCANGSAASDLHSMLEPINSLKAKFTQKVYSENGKELQSSNGNLEVQRPNLFRWEVESPSASIIVTNGKKLWNYDVDLEQVTVQKLSAKDEVSPVSFLFDDLAKLEANFAISKLGANRFEMKPKRDNANFVGLELFFNKGRLTSLIMLDHLAQSSVFEFSNIQQNTKISSSRFNFKPPAGVDIISE